MFSEILNYHQLRKISASQGGGVFGVADVSDLAPTFELSQDIRKKVTRGICLGVGLSSSVLSEIDTQPTKLYYHHYRTANMFLDRIAFIVSRWIEDRGFLAVPIPASQITDWKLQKAHASHKKIAQLAGVGWIGRNNLLVTKKFGAQLRLVTILTDMKLKTDKPLASGCGRCFLCVKACPVGAVQEKPEDFRHLLCFEKLQEFQKQNIVGQFICGICVKACSSKTRPALN